MKFSVLVTLAMLVLASPACGEQGQWQKVANMDCSVWTWAPHAHETITWSGGCKDGKTSGQGVLLIKYPEGNKMQTARYEGEMRSGKYSGHGVALDTDGLRYEGAWLDGLPHGRGIAIYSNGARYEGEWIKGRRNGQGIGYRANEGRYEGAWGDDKPNGFGTYTLPDGETYVGTWKDGCFRRGDRWATVNTTAEKCGFR